TSALLAIRLAAAQPPAAPRKLPARGQQTATPPGNSSPVRLLSATSRPQRDAALAAIERAGGQVEVEHDVRGKPFLVVTWSGGDTGLERLKALDELRWLDLSRTEITDEGLSAVRELKHLQVLKLQQTRVSDQGLAKLQGLKELEGLALHDTKTTAAGLAQLEPLVNLKVLNLSWTRTGAARLASVARLSKLDERYF